MQFGRWIIERASHGGDFTRLVLIPAIGPARKIEANIDLDDLVTLKHALALWLELEAARAENRYIPSKT